MRIFKLKTTSHMNSSQFTYYIRHERKPNKKEIERFLEKYGDEIEKDGERIYVYEKVTSVTEVKGKLIPKKKK
jgi:hypothetical protein